MSPCNDVGGRASSRAANRSIILGLTWRWSGLSWTSITIRRLPDEDAIPPGDGLEVTRTRTTRTKGLVKSPAVLTEPGDSSTVTILIKPCNLDRVSPKLRSQEDILRRPLSEWFLLLMLAAVQFTVAVDFVIMMPLGPQLIRIFDINTPAFNLAVSAYAGAAGLAGICGALFLDRFDRKTVLLTIYAGFTIGTLFCGLAPTYWTLVLARAFAGCFGQQFVGGINLAYRRRPGSRSSPSFSDGNGHVRLLGRPGSRDSIGALSRG